ncbi:MAG: MaoC family dehydratase [Anaerolineae bacterium]|jgi:acyl dehydratase|nr:MaoC family dehydratase [Anaerolineae bacterium]MBT7190620.1 MaoC family dehydratase [Anaerolineae bacterium]MBT7992132.1 MaoC family dehydratase [Anaerolineae bacterium]
MIKVGDSASITKSFSDEDVRKFAEISGDKNPVHLDDEYAAQTQFKKRLVHGMLATSLISAILGTELPGEGSIYLGQSISFRAPVFIGDTVTATVTVIKVREDKPIITLETVCKNQDDVVVIEGEAVLLAEK